jgi:uncharacterized protein YndB with AHSA1/START domain
MIDIHSQIGAIDRTVSRTPREDGGENVTVVARKTYAADLEDTWSALTDPARIARWFMAVSGDLRVGGSFELDGNPGGDILECEQPRRLRVTYGGETSIVEVRLSTDGDGVTTLELEHTVPIEMAQSGAGALWVGPGWDGALLGLGRHLSGEASERSAENSPEASAFGAASVQAWAAAVEASGTATAEQLAEAVEMSMGQYAGATES